MVKRSMTRRQRKQRKQRKGTRKVRGGGMTCGDMVKKDCPKGGKHNKDTVVSSMEAKYKCSKCGLECSNSY